MARKVCFKMGLVLAIMLIISTIFVSVSAIDYTRYALQEDFGSGSADTYSLRANSINGLNYYSAGFTKCTYGGGGSYGAYATIESVGGWDYGGLLYPTTSALKLLGANCSMIDIISFNGTLESTMGFIPLYGYDMPKYVFLIKKSTNNYSIDYYSLDNETSQFYLYKSLDFYSMTGINLTSHQIKGMTCGCPNSANCGTSSSRCFILDATDDIIYKINNGNWNVSNYPIGSDFKSDSGLPFGAVVDYDADSLNEVVFSGVYDDGGGGSVFVNYVVMDFNGNVQESHFKSICYTGGAGAVLTTEATHLYSSVCQIGGVYTEMEICVNAYYSESGQTNTAYGIVDNTNALKFSTSPHGVRGFPFTIVDLNGDSTKDFCSVYTTNNVRCYSGDDYTTLLVSITDINLYKEDYGFQSFLGGLDNNETTQELMLSSGVVVNLLPTSYLQKKFDTLLGNTSTGYLLMGGLNKDTINELIYIDTNKVNIYSTNHVELPLINYSYYATTTTIITTTTTTIGGGGTTTTTLFNPNCNITSSYTCHIIGGHGDVSRCVGGLWESFVSCPDGFHCVSTPSLVYSDVCYSDCVSPLGLDGQYKCLGGNISQCDTSVWNLLVNVTCPSGYTCINGGGDAIGDVCYPVTTTTLANNILNTGGDLVDVSNPEDAIDTSDNSNARGLLPDVYFGVVEFFKRSFIPIFGILVFVMFLMLALLILKRVQGGM